MKRHNLSFYFLILGAFMVVSLVSSFFYRTFPLFASKTLFFCQKLIGDIMFKVEPYLLNIFLIISGLVVAIGFFSLFIQIAKTHFLLKRILVNKINLPAKFAKKIEKLGLKDRVILVRDKKLFSFCYGIFSTKILISSSLLRSLNENELEAVLLHEQSHLFNRDPLKILIGKTVSSMFFFLPIFRELNKNIEAANEMLADQWTIAAQKNSAFLQGALRKILSNPNPNLAFSSNAASPDYFEIRIRKIIDPSIKQKLNISFLSIATSLIFLFTSMFLLVMPVNAGHMGFHSDSSYFLCSDNNSCTGQCHRSIDESKSYIPTGLPGSEKKCSSEPKPEKDNSASQGKSSHPSSFKYR